MHYLSMTAFSDKARLYTYSYSATKFKGLFHVSIKKKKREKKLSKYVAIYLSKA